MAYPLMTIAGIGDAASAPTSTSMLAKATELGHTIAAQRIGLAIGLAGGLAIGWFFFKRGAKK